MENHIHHTTVPLHLDALEALQLHVAGYAAHEHLSEATAYRLQLVLEELFVNAVYHGGEHHQPLDLLLARQGDAVQITMKDDGIPFDPTLAAEVDTDAPLEDRQVGGLGMEIVRQMCRDFQHSRCDGWNVLRLELPLE